MAVQSLTRRDRPVPYSNSWLLIGGMGLLLAGCASGEADVPGDLSAAEDANVRIVNVEVTPVTLSEFAGFIRVTGEVEAVNDVTVSAEESGRIERFLVPKGQRVRQGQEIAKIEDDLLAALVDEARASAKLAGEEWERQRQLWEVDSVGTEMAYLQRRYQAEIAAARQAQLEARLDRTVIRAPVSGVFDDRFVEEGEMVVPGTAVIRVVTTDQVKVTAGVPERYASSLRRGLQTRVTFDILPDREFGGRVSFLGTSVNESSRTFPIEIILNNPGGILKPAMVANVQVERERLSDVVSVPQEVVLRSADGYKVFVVEQQNDRYLAHARTVQLGPTSGNVVVIEDGLQVGELLVTVGQKLVDDGSRVRIVNLVEIDRPAEHSETQGTH